MVTAAAAAVVVVVVVAVAVVVVVVVVVYVFVYKLSIPYNYAPFKAVKCSSSSISLNNISEQEIEHWKEVQPLNNSFTQSI